MKKSAMNPRVASYFSSARKWHEEFRKLREIILDFDLTEEFKWGHPCYTLQKSNVVLMHGFKEYCAVLFMKGALLKDAKSLLVAPGKMQSGRQIRFTNLREIRQMEPTLKAYIHEAIEAEKSGLKVR